MGRHIVGKHNQITRLSFGCVVAWHVPLKIQQQDLIVNQTHVLWTWSSVGKPGAMKRDQTLNRLQQQVLSLCRIPLMTKSVTQIRAAIGQHEKIRAIRHHQGHRRASGVHVLIGQPLALKRLARIALLKPIPQPQLLYPFDPEKPATDLDPLHPRTRLLGTLLHLKAQFFINGKGGKKIHPAYVRRLKSVVKIGPRLHRPCMRNSRPIHNNPRHVIETPARNP